MNIMYIENTKTPDVKGAISKLLDAYKGEKADEIDEAKAIVKATIEESNRVARASFYKKIVSESANVAEARFNIIKSGYIPQIKLVDKYKTKSIVLTDSTEAPVDVTEVNRFVKSDIFSDDIDYVCGKLRKVLVAYDSSAFGKSNATIEETFGYSTTKYLGTEKVSMNSMKKLLQAAFDEILFVDNGNQVNKYMAKSEHIKQLLAWIAKKSSRYSCDFNSTAFVRDCIVDMLWSELNNRNLTMRYDGTEF